MRPDRGIARIALLTSDGALILADRIIIRRISQASGAPRLDGAVGGISRDDGTAWRAGGVAIRYGAHRAIAVTVRGWGCYGSAAQRRRMAARRAAGGLPTGGEARAIEYIERSTL